MHILNYVILILKDLTLPITCGALELKLSLALSSACAHKTFYLTITQQDQ